MTNSEKLKIAIDALELYAKDENWFQRSEEMIFIPHDKEILPETSYKLSGGKLARETLRKINGHNTKSS